MCTAEWRTVPAYFSLPPLFSLSEETLETGSSIGNAIVIPECPQFGNNRNDWYLEVFGGIDFPHKKMESTTGKSDYISKKRQHGKIRPFLFCRSTRVEEHI